MYRFIYLLLITIAPTIAFSQVTRETPEFKEESTKTIINEMINAHGGWDAWANAPSIKYDNIFFNTSPNAKNPWWVSTEIIEQKGSDVNDRKVYQYYHIGGQKGGFEMAYDGEEVWASSNWGIGNYPKFMTYFFYYFLNLPWLTQDENVMLSEIEEAIYNGKPIYKVEMTFKKDPAIGKVKADSFVLYIDKEQKVLLAYEYSVGFGAQLDIMGTPKERKTMGPVFRHIDEYTNINGLLFPARMHTTNTDQSKVYGNHALINYSISTTFELNKIQRPEDGVVDESSTERAE